MTLADGLTVTDKRDNGVDNVVGLHADHHVGIVPHSELKERLHITQHFLNWRVTVAFSNDNKSRQSGHVFIVLTPDWIQIESREIVCLSTRYLSLCRWIEHLFYSGTDPKKLTVIRLEHTASGAYSISPLQDVMWNITMPAKGRHNKVRYIIPLNLNMKKLCTPTLLSD